MRLVHRAKRGAAMTKQQPDDRPDLWNWIIGAAFATFMAVVIAGASYATLSQGGQPSAESDSLHDNRVG